MQKTKIQKTKTQEPKLRKKKYKNTKDIRDSWHIEIYANC